jgi:quercetin dioxygenase-like cupin family protein
MLGVVAISLVAALLGPGSTRALAQASSQAPAGALAVSTVLYTRLYTGTDGTSHFARERLAFYRLGDVQDVTFAQLKAGETEDWHVALRRQLVLCVQGVVEITAGDGEKRLFKPGQFMLLEDTTGKGHIARSVGPADHVVLRIPLPEGVLGKQQAGAAAASSK